MIVLFLLDLSWKETIEKDEKVKVNKPDCSNRSPGKNEEKKFRISFLTKEMHDTIVKGTFKDLNHFNHLKNDYFPAELLLRKIWKFEQKLTRRLRPIEGAI
jgi:hypothetical protein